MVFFNSDLEKKMLLIYRSVGVYIYLYAMHLQCSLFRQNTPAVGITCAPTGNSSVLHKIPLGIYAEREKNSNESTTNIIFCLKMI